jgi:phosphatidylglycerophosphatase A
MTTRTTAGEYVPSSAGPNPTIASSVRKPRFALFIATVCGLGYVGVAPGTFGSLAGVALALSVYQMLAALWLNDFQIIFIDGAQVDPLLIMQCLIAAAVVAAGLWSAGRASRYWRQKDP